MATRESKPQPSKSTLNFNTGSQIAPFWESRILINYITSTLCTPAIGYEQIDNPRMVEKLFNLRPYPISNAPYSYKWEGTYRNEKHSNEESDSLDSRV